MYDTIIIGGGAAGMMAAITAGRREKSVLLVETQETLGKKLSVTGNGRCNITHDPISLSAYHTDMPKRLESVLSSFDLESTRKFFESIGVSVYNREGYVYPRSNEARSVVRCMELSLQEANVQVMTGITPADILKTDTGFSVKLGLETYESASLVIACGGMAGSEVGGSDSGLLLAQGFNHRIAEPFPSLTDLHCTGLSFNKLKGIRVHGRVCIIMDGEIISEDVGEIQLTENGISGIPVFNVSYEAISGLNIKKPITAVIDLFPEMDIKMLRAYVEYRCNIGRRSIEEALLGLLPEKLIPEILKLFGLNGKKAGRLSEIDLDNLCHILKGLALDVCGYGDHSRAQVMAGGVLLHDLSDSLESDTVPGLYFVGEVVNVDGICGGYNLQWAWSSGAVVGNSI
ncbi:MAG: aminoacetone oxidase family FAD-binding enzyme [Lachnospiraceae bacterium]|nr:aminoacetone oxidase family FAD-binding enzyme [Lachnospiraceae bacterium]